MSRSWYDAPREITFIPVMSPPPEVLQFRAPCGHPYALMDLNDGHCPGCAIEAYMQRKAKDHERK